MAQPETDDGTINSEHTRILSLLDAMAHSGRSLSAAAVDRLLGRLKKQIVIHLVHEEIILQQKFEIPPESLHLMKLASGQLREAVVDSIDTMRQGDSSNVSAGVQTLRQWIEKHIEEVGKVMRTNNDGDHLEIKFLYFHGCPNAAQTQAHLQAALDELGLETEPEVIDVDLSRFEGPFLGSPSVLVNGVDVYTGTVPDAFEFSCRTFEIDGGRTGVLPTSLIRNRIESAISDCVVVPVRAENSDQDPTSSH